MRLFLPEIGTLTLERGILRLYRLTMDSVLNFVIYREDGVWVAHGLEHNIVTHGESLHEIRDNIDAVFDAYLSSGFLEKVPKASPYQWQQYNTAVESGRNLDDHLAEEALEDQSFTLELQTA
jgi:predicted RNase H-like HicB family nuclease